MKSTRFICRVVCFSLIIWGISSCGDNHSAWRVKHLRDQMEHSTSASRRQDAARALHTRYALYHAHHPGDTLYLLDWVAMALEGKEYETALECFSKYLDLHEREDVLLARAKLASGLGYYQIAWADLERASRFSGNPSNKASSQEWAGYFGRLDSVLTIMADSIRQGMDHGGLRTRRAGIYLKEGHWLAARHDLDMARQMGSQESPAFLYHDAWYSFQVEDYLSCLSILDRYLEKVDQNNEYFAEASSLRKKGKLRQTARDLEQERASLGNTHDLLVQLGKAYFELEEYSRSIAYLDIAVEQFPDSIMAYLYRGQAYLQSGVVDKASKDFEEAKKLDPGNISARNLIAYIHLLKGDLQEMRREIIQIRELGGQPLEILEKKSGEKVD